MKNKFLKSLISSLFVFIQIHHRKKNPNKQTPQTQKTQTKKKQGGIKRSNKKIIFLPHQIFILHLQKKP